MAWTTPSTRTTNTLITASIYSTDLVDNLIYLKSQTDALNAVAVLDTIANGTKVVNTVTETDLFSYTIASNTLYTGSANYTYIMQGRILAYNNRGSADNGPVIKFYYGGTAHYTHGAIASGLANGTYWLMDFLLSVAGNGATNAQDVAATYNVAGGITAGTFSTGSTGVGAGQTDAEDSTASSIVKVSITLPSASASEWGRIVWGQVIKIAA
jgi:hypothetical protein